MWDDKMICFGYWLKFSVFKNLKNEMNDARFY